MRSKSKTPNRFQKCFTLPLTVDAEVKLKQLWQTHARPKFGYRAAGLGRILVGELDHGENEQAA